MLNFDQLMQDARDAAQEASTKAYAAEEVFKAADREKNRAAIAVRELTRLAHMATWFNKGEEGNKEIRCYQLTAEGLVVPYSVEGTGSLPLVWHMPYRSSIEGGYGTGKTRYNWLEVWSFIMLDLEFTVSIRERSDLKRWKWEVRVSALREYTNDNIDLGTQQHYAADKYPGEDLESRFTSEHAARVFAQGWMRRIYADHKELITYQAQAIEAAAARLPEVPENLKTVFGKMGD